ncbi:SpoIIE family protein phosphatase [Solwaraspora sp. WMMD791]|uniref:SpoIIE family protein phosphatase n=1 Tax=Solwaraspora sp. WMMD791 TaxID=3016086 RepID=UPI00249C0840|nr:SpoIIE family protein phosphatase [Solwaraspora sp. WMMD791]WFE27401.1 SpoIIE family protein phosphatase [Solwaraspora sp. WMMD791]
MAEGDRPAGAAAAPAPATSPAALPAALAAAFDAGGEMGAMIRDRDWSATPLGPPHQWPASLSHAVAMMLSSQAQIVLYWGDEQRAFYNDAYLPTIGAKHPAALGEPAARHWSELWDVLEPLFDRVVASGTAYRGTDHPFMLERHGFLEETYFDVSYDPLRVEDGSVGGVYCVVSETTGRVLGERRLRALADLSTRLSDLQSQAELRRGVLDVLDGCRRDVPFALLYLGSDADSARLAGVTGVPADTVVAPRHPESDTAPAALLAALREGTDGSAPVGDFVAVPPDSAAAEAFVLPICAATDPVGALVLAGSRHLPFTGDYRDFFDLLARQVSSAVTNQRAYLHERARAAELAAIDQAKSDFFANVSHEFRTPLTLLLGPIEDQLDEPDLPAGHRERAEMMHRNALRLLKLVNTVLDFSRLESGRARATFQPVDLADHTNRLVSTFRSAAQRAGLDLVADCPPLPVAVHVDPDLWEKVVLNLLSNALKFTFEGGITVRLRQRDQMAELTVADTGIGIPPADLPHLFERFHRVAGARGRSHEGTGIGLALVRELVQLHGGTVAVRSEPGHGSVFTVDVPLGTGHLLSPSVGPADIDVGGVGDVDVGDSDVVRLHLAETERWTGTAPADPQATTHGVTDPVSSSRPGTPVGRVLVVDDNADLRDHVSRLLAPYWQVVTATDGTEAFDLATRTAFDLVLTDVMMPNLDGFGLVAALRADPRTRHVPVVVLSARAGPESAVEGLAAGADDYLVKPFAARELVARVRANVELGQLRGQIIRQLRALADAAIAVNTAQTTAEVLRATVAHVQRLAHAARVVATAPGARHEADGGGRSTGEPAAAIPFIGATGERLGELLVWPADEAGTDIDSAALSEFARLVGLRLGNARLYEAEHRIATTLQHSLLPQTLPRVPGALLASRYLPGNAEAEVGGDWYDALEVGGGRLVLVIGDVVGKGVSAAATMGQLRNALRAYLLEGFAPGDALTRLNRLMATMSRRSLATVVCLSVDASTGELRYASAGHPPPVLVADGTAHLLHERALGPPIGAIPASSYETSLARLDVGTRLICYTDGLIEDRTEGIDAGLDQVRADAVAGGDHVEDVADRLLRRVARRPRRDDVAVLVLETTELDRLTLRLPAQATKLALLRRRLEDFFTAHGLSETDQFDLTVAISEAAANAIEHPVSPADSDIWVDVSIDGDELTASVRDSGGWREATDAGFRGRGLALIAALAQLRIDRDEHGSRVTLGRRLAARTGRG